MSLPRMVADVINQHVTLELESIRCVWTTKPNSITQYFKEGRALRTELTVHDPYDFGVGRRLENLSVLRKHGFAANRCLLSVQKTSQDFVLKHNRFRPRRALKFEPHSPYPCAVDP